MTTTSGTQTIAGVERALDVLNLFLEEGVIDLGVTEIAERLSISKAVVHRILSSFKAKDFIDVDPRSRRYRLGSRVLELGLSYLDRIDVQDTVKQAMHELVRLTGETATMSIRSGWSRVYVAQVNPPRDIRMVVPLGASYPLHAGASSKALLAFLPEELREAYLERAPFDSFTPKTVTDVKTLRSEIEEIRARGYALSLGERETGAGAVAAPVMDHTGQPVVGVSVCGPLERFTAEADQCADTLMTVLAGVSRRLGYLPGDNDQRGPGPA